ncbi:MAG: glycosyl hydrolase [Ignavibacteriae bacterium HGW-Ignavibacteriae-4]|nr:MAG: glycosyl hydrolase [Ignavibacteriae bacterium HGW-Ignavibacteriae-4]
MKNIIYILVLILSMSSVQSALAQNVLITNVGQSNEPSIMMDYNNPNILVAGANLNYVYNSSDGGLTWKLKTLNSTYGVWGDPAINVDTEGNFYFFHLSNTPGGNWIDRIVCQKSEDEGDTWSNGSYTGLSGTKAQDKQWSAIDRNNNNIYLTWTEFDKYGSSNTADSSRILFSKSLDAGETWSEPKKINQVSGDCIDNDNTVEGAVPAVGPNGEVYVSWASARGIVFNRSTDEGETWMIEDIIVDSLSGGWAYDIPGILRCNGLPVTKCDLSGGPNHGTIYINWSDQKNGLDNTDIWLKKSTDGGNTWSESIRVNDDNSEKHQFLTWMDIDQINGNLFFVFYDRRNYDDTKTDVYMALSTDGGSKFINTRISESPFIPNEGVFFGDYSNIVAHNNIVRPIWTRFDSGKLSTWTNVTPLDEIISSVDSENAFNNNDTRLYPNPTPNISYVSFKLHELSSIKLELFDEKGKLIKTIIDNEDMGYGGHIIPINMNELNLTSGSYYYTLSIDGKVKTLKTILMK